MMKISSILTAAIAILFVTVGCKKEEESTKKYLNGSITITVEGQGGIPAYVAVGDKFNIKPSGLYCKDDPSMEIGYYFYTSLNSAKDSIMTAKHPVETYEFTVPGGHLEQISFTCVGFPIQRASEYYTSSITSYFTIVSDSETDGSLTNMPDYYGDTKVSMNGRWYRCAEMGGKVWMRENLAYQGHPFMDCKAMTNIFGSYYSWEEAQTVCPAGWHLPSDAEFVALCKSAGASADLAELENAKDCAGRMMGDVCFNGERLWLYYKGVSATDETHFTAIPTGYAALGTDGFNFSGYGDYAVFWTSTESDGRGVYRYIYKENNDVYCGQADKAGLLASVRCVKN